MPSTTHTARRLRREQTDAERSLWLRLRDRHLAGWKFRRQVPINGYVVDFCCADGKLIVEIDGGQHAEQVAADAARTKSLEAGGYLVLRFWNGDVMRNLDGVVETISRTLPSRAAEPPHPDPLPAGEREKRS